MSKQTKTTVFYSINVTLAPLRLPLDINNIVVALEKIEKALAFLEEVKATFFIDVFMMMRIEQKNPEQYVEIQQRLNSIYKKGHDFGVYINMEWHNRENLHQLEFDSVLDVFVHGRDEILKIMRLNSGKIVKKVILLKEKLNDENTPEIPVRISNGKLQPFVHLLDAYKFINAKLDVSVFAKLVAPAFYNYKKIVPGLVYRFSKDPTQPQRFGQFLSLPRCVFSASSLWCFRSDRLLKKRIRAEKEKSTLFVSPEIEMSFSPIRAKRQEHIFLLSPDTLSRKRFVKSVNRIKIPQGGIISVESFLANMSHISFNNLETLIESKMNFVKASDITKKFGVSTNQILFK